MDISNFCVLASTDAKIVPIHVLRNLFGERQRELMVVCCKDLKKNYLQVTWMTLVQKEGPKELCVWEWMVPSKIKNTAKIKW